tara:strand:+ start:425 stop:1324 length:900 start_codon:yes stop_codon:yes gene_type:complete
VIQKKRPWSDSVSFDPRWKPNGRLARHRPYFFYEDDDLAPCDPQGFRVPTGHLSIAQKYQETKPSEQVFCYGGSTTFGVYCSYDDAYPAQLERLINRPCFNMGLQTLDLYGSYLNFVDHLRVGLVPEVAVFLDGVNENQGFIQSVEDNSHDYAAEFRQYRGFRDLILNASIKHRFMRYFLNTASEKHNNKSSDPYRFVYEQAQHYHLSRRAIEKIACAFGFRVVFLLQPCVWDVWEDGADDPRYVYLKALYKEILRQPDHGITDISSEVSLVPECFYDWAHINSEGNAALAETIALKIL